MFKILGLIAMASLGALGASTTNGSDLPLVPDEIPPACQSSVTCTLLTPSTTTLSCTLGTVTIFDTALDASGDGNRKGSCTCNEADVCVAGKGSDNVLCKVSRTITITNYTGSATVKSRSRTFWPGGGWGSFGSWSATGSSVSVSMLEQCGIQREIEIAAFDNISGELVCGTTVYRFGCEECEGGC